MPIALAIIAAVRRGYQVLDSLHEGTELLICALMWRLVFRKRISLLRPFSFGIAPFLEYLGVRDPVIPIPSVLLRRITRPC